MSVESQSWSAEMYDHNVRFVSDLGGAVFDWLAPQAGERVLDLGCGDGALTVRIAEAGASVFGVDASNSFVDAARKRGLDAQLGDGQKLDFDAEFDAVFSNAALHWMTASNAVASGIYKALKPGGRFVAEFGGHGNVAAIVTAMRGAALRHGGDLSTIYPWFFPTVEEYTAILEKAGFTVSNMILIPRPTPLPTGMKGWLSVFSQPFFDQYKEPLRTTVLDDVVQLLEWSLCDESGNWTADYVRLRLAAVKPG